MQEELIGWRCAIKVEYYMSCSLDQQNDIYISKEVVMLIIAHKAENET